MTSWNNRILAIVHLFNIWVLGVMCKHFRLQPGRWEFESFRTCEILMGRTMAEYAGLWNRKIWVRISSHQQHYGWLAQLVESTCLIHRRFPSSSLGSPTTHGASSVMVSTTDCGSVNLGSIPWSLPKILIISTSGRSGFKSVMPMGLIVYVVKTDAVKFVEVAITTLRYNVSIYFMPSWCNG